MAIFNKVYLKSGLTEFIKGLFKEKGFKNQLQINLRSAMNHFQEGARTLDPFCFYRLSEIWSREEQGYEQIVPNKNLE
jgi:hypothetical protein